ncbi:MAG: hypothetical protein ACYCWW_13110 [Deltaproteobacteria bacterium]
MRWLLLLAPLCALACTLPADNPSSVHDLRILAIAATPPELRYPVHGNAAKQQCEPDLSGVFASGPIALSALVADPGGAGRSLDWSWTFCPPTSDERCPAGSAYVLAQGSGPPSQIAASWDIVSEALTELSVQQSCGAGQSCPPTPLLTTFAQNPLGLCRFGVWLQLGLEIDAPGGETIHGSKLLVFTPVPDDYPTDAGVCPQGPDGGMPPHGNPPPVPLRLNGSTLPVASTATAQLGEPLTLTPTIPSGAEADYCVPNFEGGWTRLTETWLISLMTSIGTFDQEQVGAGGFGNISGGPIDYNVHWSADDAGTATVYEITRDGRGGTSWTTRSVELTP